MTISPLRTPPPQAESRPPVRRLRRFAVRAPSALRPIDESHGLAWVRRREHRYRRGLALSDVVLTFVLLGLTVEFGRGGGFGLALFGFAAGIVLGAKLLGLYDRDDLRVHKTTLEEVPRLVFAVTSLLFAFVLYERAASPYITAAPDLVLAWASLVGGLTLGRWAVRRVLERWCGLERCLILGERDIALDVEARTLGHGGIAIIARQPLTPETTGAHALAGFVHADVIDRVIIAPDDATPSALLHETIRRCKRSGARVSVLPSTGNLTSQTSEVDDLAGTLLLGIRRFRPTRSSRLLKRTFDLVAGAFLLLLAAPLILVLAVLVRLDSPGPGIYRQIRVGRHGRRFTVLKLRTMVADAETRREELEEHNEVGGGMFKIKLDPRITRVGAFLRRTHMDELPQLLNVLRGDMSLVGPRPLVLEEDELVDGTDRTRLDLTPGMTGPWQVVGGSGRRVPMEDMLRLDYVYVSDWSLWRDVIILVRTAKLIISRGGA